MQTSLPNYNSVIERLTLSEHPAIRYKARLTLLGEYPQSPAIAQPTIGRVDWGGLSSTRMNEFVTIDALYVPKMAERL